MSAQIIDVHAHVIPRELTSAAGHEPWRPRISWHGGIQIAELDGRQVPIGRRDACDPDRIAEETARAGVDRIVLSPWVGLLGYDLAPEEGLELARIQNAALATAVRRHPDRLAALGTVPLQDPELAAAALEEVMDEPALSGVEVTATVAGRSLGDDALRPFWAAAERLRALVFVHPTGRGLPGRALHDHFLWNTVGNPIETAVAAAHMTMAGVLEDHPRLRVLLAHGGGALLAVRGRLRHAHAVQPAARDRLGGTPDESLRRFYYDTLTHDAALLAALIDYAGADHVVLGSDYPFAMGLERPADVLSKLGLADDAERAILGGVAKELLRAVDTNRRER